MLSCCGSNRNRIADYDEDNAPVDKDSLEDIDEQPEADIGEGNFWGISGSLFFF